jgi:hypothetical protein
MAHGAGHELLHLAAATVLAVGGGIHVVLAWTARSRRPPAPSTASGIGQASDSIAVAVAGTVLLATLSLAAAVIHLAATPAHVAELGLLGWGFVAVAAFQAAWALAFAIDPSRFVALAGIAGNLAVLAAWAWSRTVGLPVGPEAGMPEPVGAPDGIAATLELLLVAWLVIGLAGLPQLLARRVRDVRSLATIAVVPAVGLVFLATTLAVALALADDHARGEPHEHPAAVEPHH